MSFRIDAISAATDGDLRSLATFLAQEDGLAGRIELTESPQQAGHLGGLADALTVALGSGGAVTVLVGAITVWIRSRGSDIKLKITETESRRMVELDGRRIRDADAAQIRALIQGSERTLRAEVE